MTHTNPLETAQFRACAGQVQGFGITPREALEDLLTRFSTEAPTPIVILPFNRGDSFFTDAQQERLRELKANDNRTNEENNELESLIETTFDATIARTQSLQQVKQ
jgi:hypothetical protein